MKIEMQLTGLDGVHDLLLSLPAEIVSKRGGPVRAALRKGAVVIYKAERANLQRSLANEPRYSTGLLLENLIISRGKQPGGSKGEKYLVRVRRKTYVGSGGKNHTIKAAQLLEYGSGKQPAEPWIRPAFESKAREAIETIERELVRSVDRIVKKLAQQNKGK